MGGAKGKSKGKSKDMTDQRHEELLRQLQELLSKEDYTGATVVQSEIDKV